MEKAKFIRRVNIDNYVEDHVVSITIGAGGGTATDTVENVPLAKGTAYEFEIEGRRVVFIGYEVS